MSGLTSLLGLVTTVLQAHPDCKEVEIIQTKEFSLNQYFFKIRAAFSQGYKFQARIYFNRSHIDYAYQLFTDIPLLRWDNKEEFRDMETFPHHFHNFDGNVSPSPLTGDPYTDLQLVLQEVGKFIADS